MHALQLGIGIQGSGAVTNTHRNYAFCKNLAGQHITVPNIFTPVLNLCGSPK